MRGFLFYIIGSSMVTLALARYNKHDKTTNTDWILLGIFGVMMFLAGIAYSVLPDDS